ncbi:predicted protein [Naegleria gruberi]|uniref:Predicted protein n=1 Tax=Naegleria gruberi TaxID=5762 RepID=D2VY17_NAEGR|nr:uncharacterized protein NAEGRDRAFT_73938 [Naegleria gruberi]EFC38246.1 predicted protein [Naegleria gruberi]|eukprot:XP_002670990.1 predicted protein [Naegleria gruberi strain NEG-M]
MTETSGRVVASADLKEVVDDQVQQHADVVDNHHQQQYQASAEKAIANGQSDVVVNDAQVLDKMGEITKNEMNQTERFYLRKIVAKTCSDPPNLIIYSLIILFGLSSWIAVNGIYSEIPLLGYVMPEGYAIAVDMNLSLQLANIVPFMYFVFMIFKKMIQRKLKPTTTRKSTFDIVDTVSILSLFVIGIGALIGMSFLWNIPINGRSWPFLIMMFLVGVSDCTSTLLFYPFVLHFKHAYSSALLIGESLTGLIASIISIIQNSTPTPLFPFWVFCIIIAGITAISLVSYCLLRFLPYSKKELRRDVDALDEETRELIVKKRPLMTWSTVRLIFFQFLISCSENGVVVSIMPYVFAHYKHHATLLQYAITIGMIISPIASGVAYLVPFYNFFIAMFCHLIWIVGACFLTVIAFNNPNPPLKYSTAFGGFLVVVAILTKGFMSFCKTKEFLHSHQVIEKQDEMIYKKLLLESRKKTEQTQHVEEKLEQIEPISTEQQEATIVPNGEEIIDLPINQKKLTFGERLRDALTQMDLNPFRCAGFGIQIGALVATVTVKLFSDAHYFS